MARVRKMPQRMCVGCREMKNKKELIRIVRTPAGDIEIDPTGKKSGRGAYICPDQTCFDKAMQAKRLQKSLEREIPVEIIDKIRQKLIDIAP